MWAVFALGSALFAGLTAVLAKVGLRDVDSNLATALRTVVVLAFSWLMVAVTGVWQPLRAIDGRSLAFLALSGAATGASWLCYFRALQLGDVSRVAAVDKSSTLLAMLMSVLFLGEALTWTKAAAIALIAVGTGLMLSRPEPGAPRSRGLAYALGSAVFAALTAILGKVGIQNVDSTLGTALRTCVVLAMAWGMAFLTGAHPGIRSLRPKTWAFLALAGVATGASWLCYYRALQDGPASAVVPIDKLSILVTVGFSRLVFGDRLSAKALTGLGLLTAGTLMTLL